MLVFGRIEGDGIQSADGGAAGGRPAGEGGLGGVVLISALVLPEGNGADVRREGGGIRSVEPGGGEDSFRGPWQWSGARERLIRPGIDGWQGVPACEKRVVGGVGDGGFRGDEAAAGGRGEPAGEGESGAAGRGQWAVGLAENHLDARGNVVAAAVRGEGDDGPDDAVRIGRGRATGAREVARIDAFEVVGRGGVATGGDRR